MTTTTLERSESGSAFASPCPFTPHDYQQDALDNIERDLGRSFKRLVVLLATGLGKSVVIGLQARRTPGRIMVLVHTEQLVNDLIETLMICCPDRTVGKVQADANQCEADIVVCSVATLGRSAARRDQVLAAGPISLVMVDECHHAMADSYLTTLQHFDAYSTDEKHPATVPVIGFTATLHRPDGKPLGNLWQKITIKRDRQWGIEHGYLVPLRKINVRLPKLDLAKIEDTAGDYDQARLGTALVSAGAGEKYARAVRDAGLAEAPGMVFTPTVGAADHVAADFCAAGIPAEVVHGGLSSRQREAIMDRFDAGETLVLINCNTLTEGFNRPKIRWVLVKPTKSPGLLDQMIGRGTRTAAGKTECVIIDPQGVMREHAGGTPSDLIKKRMPIEPPVQTVRGCDKPVQGTPERSAGASQERQERPSARPAPASYRVTAKPGEGTAWWVLSVSRCVADEWSEVATKILPVSADLDRAAALIIKIDKIKRIEAAKS